MTDINFSARAYCKIILHAAKYPHCAINGLLLAKQKSKADGKVGDLQIEDVIPLFHISLNISPMAEIALTLVDQYAQSKGLALAGYYLANENVNDVSTDLPAHRIADKIAENYNGALLVVVDNMELSPAMNSSPLQVYQCSDGKWKLKDKTSVTYEDDVSESDVLCTLMKNRVHKQLIDFDNHLDNISLDWQNMKLNEEIKEKLGK